MTTQQSHAGFFGRAAAFLCITGQAATDGILPGRPASATSRNNMVKAELVHWFRVATILTPMAVSREEIATVEPERVPGNPIVVEQSNHPRNLDAKVNGANPIILGRVTVAFGANVTDQQP